MKILHVIKWFGVGGVETWLLNVVRHIDSQKFAIDILVQEAYPGTFDAEAEKCGARMLVCEGAPNPILFARNFRNILKKYGPYDVVHSHVHHFSGYVLAIAKFYGVKGRIAHCHNYILMHAVSVRRKAYLQAMKKLIDTCATDKFAVSSKAADDLFGVNWKSDNRCKIYPCAIDCSKFTNSDEFGGRKLRNELGLPKNAKVIGHVGRFTEQKNHKLLIDITADLLRNDTSLFVLMVGDGPLMVEVKKQVEQLGVAGQCVFTGIRHDVSDLMRFAMDYFVFPSLHEGLGLVLVEAQAAGLPCLVSDAVPQEACVLADRVVWCSLQDSKEVWQEELKHLMKHFDLTDPRETVSILHKAKLPYCLEENLKFLQDVYAHYEG